MGINLYMCLIVFIESSLCYFTEQHVQKFEAIAEDDVCQEPALVPFLALPGGVCYRRDMVDLHL
jgi:hypothetical protein